MRFHISIMTCVISVFYLAYFSISCSRNSGADAPAPVKIQSAPDPSLIDVERPEQFPLVKVETRKSPDELRVNGVVAPDVSRTVHVSSLSGGRVIDIRARLGDDVKKGQVLLVIHSPELATAIADYQKFQADEQLARRSLERAQLLFSHGAMAQKDLQQAEDTEQKAKVDLQTAAERIRILGGNLNHLSPIIEVRSPISGTVVEQNTTGGEAVKSLDNSPSLFTVGNLSRVWVLCDVYENHLAQVHWGDIAEVRLNAYPEQRFSGRVSNISRVLDPATRAAKVRVDLENRQGLMRPGMFAGVMVVSRSSHERIFVPTSAILRLHDKDWVFRPVGDHRFRRTEVQTGLTTPDGFQEILKGLQAGDAVVTNALQFSSSAEQK